MQGEVEYAVPPLAEPEAVELFCTRSQLDSDRDRESSARASTTLPLAVELAAARTKALSPAQILERLSQRLDFSRAAATPRPASRRCGRRSNGPTSCFSTRSSSSSLASRSSPAAARSKRQRTVCGADVDTCSRWSRRACSLQPTSATGCWRRSASTQTSGSRSLGDADGRRASCTPQFFLASCGRLGMTYESIEIHGAQRHDIVVSSRAISVLRLTGPRAGTRDHGGTLAVSLEGFWVALSPHGAVRRFGVLVGRERTMPVGLRRVAGGVSLARPIFTGRIEDSIEQNEKSLRLYRRVR